jgi:hypothetical protein
VYGDLSLTKREHFSADCKAFSARAEFNHVFLRWNKTFDDSDNPFEMFRALSGRKKDVTAKASEFLQSLCGMGVGFSPLAARAILSVKGRRTLWYPRDVPEIGIHRIGESKVGRHWYEFTYKKPKSALPLEKFLEEIEGNAGNDSRSKLVYVADITFKRVRPKPETLISRIWSECLGAKTIPFEPKARRVLIEHGRQHPELKRHIEAWEEMKRAGSKWVTGDVA